MFCKLAQIGSLALVLMAASCDDDNPATNDGGQTDAGGLPDAGGGDAVRADAGGTDTGAPDAAAAQCPGGGAPVATTSVTALNYRFDPPCIRVAPGSTVTWTNASDPTHTVTSDPGAPVSFNSGALGAGGTFQFTFSTAGTVGYHCIPHQSLGMEGTVIVE